MVFSLTLSVEKTVMKIAAKTLLVLLVSLGLSGCLKDKVTRSYTLFKPVYESKEKVLASITSGPGQKLKKPGKIYVYGNFLFVNEVNEGIHVFSYADPANPVNKAFIKIPGNLDIAVRGNTLYADLYSDMLTLDISDPLDAKVTHQYTNVFNERNYGHGFVADSSQYIVGWEQRDTTVNFEESPVCVGCGTGMIWLSGPQMSMAEGSFYAGSKTPVGVAGSMARFSLVDNYLYLVSAQSLQTFDVSTPETPLRVSDAYFAWGTSIETIYPFRDKLFIGSTTGMFIFDISTSGQPQYVSGLAHFRSCDPVITDGDYAFVTLRTGTICGGIQESELQVVDVRNIQQPVVVSRVAMKEPYGLGLSGASLWVCDGEEGLKIIDVTDPLKPSLKRVIGGINPFDVIPLNEIMIVSAKEGIFLYENKAAENIKLISKLN